MVDFTRPSPEDLVPESYSAGLDDSLPGTPDLGVAYPSVFANLANPELTQPPEVILAESLGESKPADKQSANKQPVKGPTKTELEILPDVIILKDVDDKLQPVEEKVERLLSHLELGQIVDVQEFRPEVEDIKTELGVGRVAVRDYLEEATRTVGLNQPH